MLSVNLAMSVMKAELHKLALNAECRFPECHYAVCCSPKEIKFEKVAMGQNYWNMQTSLETSSGKISSPG
jgi:hypothetical protein